MKKQWKYLKEVLKGESVELVRALVPMDDFHASFQILRLSAICISFLHLPRTAPFSIMRRAAADYYALVEWTFASIIIAGNGTSTTWLPTPE